MTYWRKLLVTSNGTSGIIVLDQARPNLVANTCNANGDHGIVVLDQAQPTLEANACQENAHNGIYYSNRSSGTARQNVCSANRGYGILVNEQAQPTLETNTCQENNTGIVYLRSAAGIARHNVCSGNKDQQIRVEPSAQPQLQDNRSYLSSDQTERILYEEIPVEATLYDGRPNFLIGCYCTITDRRLVLQCDRGGTQQVLLRDITQVSPEIRLLSHRVVVKLPGMVYTLKGKGKDETRAIASRIQEAMMS